MQGGSSLLGEALSGAPWSAVPFSACPRGQAPTRIGQARWPVRERAADLKGEVCATRLLAEHGTFGGAKAVKHPHALDRLLWRERCRIPFLEFEIDSEDVANTASHVHPPLGIFFVCDCHV